MDQRGFSLLVPSSCFSLGVEPDQGGLRGRRRGGGGWRSEQHRLDPTGSSLDGGEMVSRRSQRLGRSLGNVQAPRDQAPDRTDTC